MIGERHAARHSGRNDMSMFGDILGGLTGDQAQGKGGLMKIAAEVLQRAGGVQGLLAMLDKAGLGDQVRSWIGSGANQPVSGEQVGAALHEGGLGPLLQEAARHMGVGQGELHGQLAQMLPQVVDHLTPDGQAPQGNEGFDLSALSGLAGKLLG
jgi:uncharacterized protein YidB (DUF937 family)